MAAEDEGKIRYSACLDDDGNWYATTAERSKVVLMMNNSGNSTLELGVFGLSVQNSDVDGNTGPLALTNNTGLIIPDRFTDDVNINLLFDPYGNEDFEGIDLSITQEPTYVSALIESTSDVNIINSTNTNKLGLGDTNGNFSIIEQGNQLVSYLLTTPDAQFDYTGVRVFGSGASKIVSFNQPMFVGNTYTFSFYVKSLVERRIYPGLSYDGIGTSGVGIIGPIYYSVQNLVTGDWTAISDDNLTIGGTDEWIRVAARSSLTSADSLQYLGADRGVWIDNSNTIPISDLYVWGVQLELGTTPSDYIAELGGNLNIQYDEEQ